RRWPIWTRTHGLLLLIRKYLFSRASLAAVGLSLILHISTIGAVLLSARGFAIPLEATTVVAVVPASLLLSAVPVSLAGWGVRDAAIVVGLGVFGVGRADAAVLSVWLGVSVLLSSIPGGLLWAASRREAAVERDPALSASSIKS